MKQTIITVEQSVGLPLAHDLTLIDTETKYKGARFKRGHVVVAEDLPTLRAMGREHLSVIELSPDEVHEDTAALRLAGKFASKSFTITGPSEGRCNLIAGENGLFAFDERMVGAINSDPDWVFATIANHSVVEKGDLVAAWRIGPLVMTEERVAATERAIDAAEGAKFAIAAFRPLKSALVTIGTEIARGRKQDAFAEKLPRKLARYGAPFLSQTILEDDRKAIAQEIVRLCDAGAEAVFCTGGMSVDADDLTPDAIRDACDEVIFKGVPTLPGSNLMLAKRGNAFVFGVPACAVHAEVTTLDVVMNRVFAGIPPRLEEVRSWGAGGLCRACEGCNFPVCAFGSR